MITTLTITRPDDWHVHFRDGELLPYTVQATAQHFARALVMPNLKPALTTYSAVMSYRNRIISALDSQASFTPYMSLYLSEQTIPQDLIDMKQSPYVLGAKLYPAGATTHSEQGIHDISSLYPLFEVMQACDLVLQIHGETTRGDIFSREACFIKNTLTPLIQQFPRLRVVLEHISTRAAVHFVQEAPPTVAATITPHHLLYNRNDLLAGGLKPHYYCLPILKTAADQRALQAAAVSGNEKFFAGTDSAPHATQHKESACGCAGIYSAPFAVALYAELFDELNQLNRLDAFMGHFGAQFYQLPKTTSTIELIRQPQSVPNTLPFGHERVVPMAAGNTLHWSIHASL